MTQTAPSPAGKTPGSFDGDAADSLTRASALLMDQALTLDAMFGELAQQAADRMENWPGFAKDYVSLALRAQSNCRAALSIAVKAEAAARHGQGDEAA
jgi:hypothetical protein